MKTSFGGGTRSESTSRSLKGRESPSVAQEGDRTGSEGVARLVSERWATDVPSFESRELTPFRLARPRFPPSLVVVDPGPLCALLQGTPPDCRHLQSTT